MAKNNNGLDNTQLIRKLGDKKHRDARKLFLVEGEKSLIELLGSDFEIEFLVVGATFQSHHFSLLQNSKTAHKVIDEKEIRSLSTLEHNIAGIAIVKQKLAQEPDIKKMNRELVLALDGVRDPGNLGTMIRIADWYGVRHIIASPDTADYYNPKSISASMGSFARVDVHYTNLFSFLEKAPLPLIGSFLDGTDIHKMHFPEFGVLIIGNESNGISEHLEQLIKHKITIKRYGGAESLNAAIATAIILDNWRGSIA